VSLTIMLRDIIADKPLAASYATVSAEGKAEGGGVEGYLLGRGEAIEIQVTSVTGEPQALWFSALCEVV